MLFTADLHYALKQYDWLVANAKKFDSVILGGHLLDLTSVLELDVQMLVVEKYLYRLREEARVLITSGNHDGDSRNPADESVARWIRDIRTNGVFADGDSLEVPGHFVTL